MLKSGSLKIKMETNIDIILLFIYYIRVHTWFLNFRRVLSRYISSNWLSFFIY